MQLPAPVSMESLAGPAPAVYAFEQVTPNNYGLMAFEGTVHTVCEALASVALNGDLSGKLWQPARLVRAVIQNHRRGGGHIALLNQAAGVALNMYAGVPDAEGFDRLQAGFQRYGLMDTVICQTADNYAQETSEPKNAQRQAEAITSDYGDTPPLFIALCHGGLLHSMQAFLYHQRERRDGVLYPVRHSTDKEIDLKPYLTPGELRYLGHLAEGRVTVVYDDDASEGTTVKETIELLRKQLAPGQPITGHVSKDWRDPKDIESQGVYWEHVAAGAEKAWT